MTSYNGYSNWQTWNIMLWINNEEPLYRCKMAFLRNADIDEDSVAEFLSDCFPDGTPDMDGRKDMMQIDLAEVVEYFREEAKEYFGETWDEECERNARTPGTQQWAETSGDDLGESPDY